MDGVEASLRRLQTDYIDLYQIHGNDFRDPCRRDTSRSSTTLVQQGKVRYIGCSNWQAWKIAKALGISEYKNLARFDTLQAYYSIAGRDPRTGNRSPARSRKDRSARVESACRRLTFGQVSAGHRRSPPTRAAPNMTFPSWTKSGPGIFST